MSDSLPIPARSGIARAPLDPTDVVPGPQPIEPTERDGHHVIVGEVLRGRHRSRHPRRRVAVSGALLSAAGVFVTLALMMSHNSTSASASPRVAPSTPVPDLPDAPTASSRPTPTATPTRISAPVVFRARSAAPVARRSPWSERHAFGNAAELRQEAVKSAEAWADAMRQAYPQAARQQGATAGYQAGAWQAPDSPYGSQGSRGHGHHHRGYQGR